MFNEDPLPFFDREQGFRGREEINLLVYAYRSILPLYPSLFFFSFFLPFPSQCLLILLQFSPRGCCYNVCDCDTDPDPLAVHGKALFYSAYYDQILPF